MRDDFAGSKLNARWRRYVSAKANGGVWAAKQVRVRRGELQILGQGKNPTGSGNRSGGVCWCGPGSSQLYGTWQVRAKFDAGPGYGQDIGLWPQSEDGAADGHFSLAISDPARKRSTWHAMIAPGGKTSSANTPGDFTAWHVFGVEWRATFVRMWIDGKSVFDSRKNAPDLAIPRTPMYLHLQQEIGPKGNIPAPTSKTPSTVTMHVDWVKYAP